MAGSLSPWLQLTAWGWRRWTPGRGSSAAAPGTRLSLQEQVNENYIIPPSSSRLGKAQEVSWQLRFLFADSNNPLKDTQKPYIDFFKLPNAIKKIENPMTVIKKKNIPCEPGIPTARLTDFFLASPFRSVAESIQMEIGHDFMWYKCYRKFGWYPTPIYRK